MKKIIQGVALSALISGGLAWIAAIVAFTLKFFIDKEPANWMKWIRSNIFDFTAEILSFLNQQTKGTWVQKWIIPEDIIPAFIGLGIILVCLGLILRVIYASLDTAAKKRKGDLKQRMMVKTRLTKLTREK